VSGHAGDPPAVPGRVPDGAEVVQTHISTLYLTPGRVFKAKRPVRFGFCDFSTRELRRAACEAEVAVNRRIAPDVYLGVEDLVAPGAAEPEPMVVMRRMPDDRRLATLVRAGADVGDQLRAVARQLVAFHVRAPRSPAIDELATVDATRVRWEANWSELARFVGSVLDPDVVDAARAEVDTYLAGRAALFASRLTGGHACDGHGDLQAADIFCLDDGPRILDAVEFDPDLRADDVVADVAFLAMDLERLGRPDLARDFVAAYEEHDGRRLPASLLHLHIAHRAQIRAKVACLRAEQEPPGSAHEQSVDLARSLLDLCLAHLRMARVRIVIVGGLPGTGKSTLAAALADRDGAVLIRSDEVRKQRAGLDPSTARPAAVGAGLYTAEATAAVYAELVADATRLAGMGERVVLDASWSDVGPRAVARDAARQVVADLVELRCSVAAETAAARIEARRRRGRDASDATAAVAAAMADRFDDWPEAHEVATDAAPAVVVDEVWRWIEA
jgi:aminoglycoside phosphotransferase family enzyme/predicted kinase